ncbi:MAG: sugar phosphate isomerase/epimerase [Pirellulaceae bacterium]|nr:sugar phosphate isomerase/epimerase [Pirellulaceae bacterium]
MSKSKHSVEPISLEPRESENKAKYPDSYSEKGGKGVSSRRNFIKRSALVAGGIATLSMEDFLKGGSTFGRTSREITSKAKSESSLPDTEARLEKLPFKISLAQWSLHVELNQKKIDNLDFAKVTKEEFGIEAVEYVNSFFKRYANDEKYLAKMKKRADDYGVKSLLIMVDGEGQLGHADEKRRKKAVENHYKWIEAAKFLGCHSIRVNANSSGTFEEQQKRAADGLSQLSDFAAKHEMNVLVENHGGFSSNGKWLVGVMKLVNKPNCGTLPDFGNFYEYDRYQGVTDLIPYAKAVSAKSHLFDENGDEKKIDYYRMMKIVLDAGYDGYVGIEYEGTSFKEREGIHATHKLLKKIQKAHTKSQPVLH